ncbi:outer membrane beta-barrel protein [Chryseobacterium paridis]|uniref:Outer membrane beta-barrel protein n=1 Tax=Chryseobacterium paridis TaxID=2800328 RepID=A0ABS1FR56_9FLAO|nr:outer membrane beta-barrel protein [Chryseobacterium paridis]MBK1894905.1 outer membrane beta-barrel protein [Chryseobacterium paridis]
MKYININHKSIEDKVLNALFLLLSIAIYSQQYPLKFGLKGGWNYSNVRAIDENGDRSGYRSDIIDEAYVGFAFEKQVLEKSYLQSVLLVSFTDRVTFLELPIYYKYNFYKKFSFFAGPKLNYIPDDEISQPYYFRRRFGLSVDLGVDYKLSNHFLLEGSFSKGLTRQYDDLALTYYQARRDVYRVGLIYFFN